MRQIEKAMCAAVKARFNWHCSNTEVKVEGNSVKVYLHGNLIYKENIAGVAAFTLAGWNSNTTRSRLKALGVHVRSKNFAPQVYKNGEWIDIRSNDSNEWYMV